MSEEVYFNEPGYEGEAGTVEGEKKNEGYSNIVRLCNIKYAMIKQIKDPIKGFEDIIRKHFYIKRDVVLKECKKWVKYAEVRPCSYSGLVSDHNHKYCTRFNANPKNYINDLKAAIKDLEVCLKELVQNNEISKIFSTTTKSLSKKKKKSKKKKQDKGEDLLEIMKNIDITYDD